MSYYMADGTQIDADDPEPDANDLLKIISDLMNVAQWYRSFYHDVQAVAPEYFELCADLNATAYLHGEAENIRNRAARLLTEWRGDPEDEAEQREVTRKIAQTYGDASAERTDSNAADELPF